MLYDSKKIWRTEEVKSLFEKSNPFQSENKEESESASSFFKLKSSERKIV